MPRFHLTCHVTVSARTVVVAETPEAAIAEARSRGIELDFVGAGNDARHVWLIDEADG